jgi:TctA family transporter
VLIALLGAPLTKLALAFGPAEYFSLMVLGLIFAVVLAKGSVLKAIAMIAFGVLLSMVGSDIETGASRMSFNIPELADGLASRRWRWVCSVSPRSSAISIPARRWIASWCSRRSPA